MLTPSNRTIICDKCKSGNVELFKKPEKEVEKELITMKDFAKDVKSYQIIPAIYRYTTMVLLCKDCGHRLEYTV